LQNLYDRPNIEDENYNPTNTSNRMTYYEENGEGGFTSDLTTSVFDFFVFVSFLASSFNFLVSFFPDPLSFLAMFPAPCGAQP
jgi:hypothetical protein